MALCGGESNDMNWIFRFATSSIGAKVVMALSGTAIMGFVVAHMVGNLQIFLGPEVFNAYGEFLQGTLGHVLWFLRGGLLLAVVLHVVSGVRLSRLNRAARPVAYATKKSVRSTFASRSMPMTGLVLLAFIIFHLLHFTFGVIQPEYYPVDHGTGAHDIYSMFIHGFQNPAIAISYIVANGLLALHLSHGARSLFQSLGLRAHKYEAIIKCIGYSVAVVVGLPNMFMPLAVMMGLIGLPGGGH